MKTNEMNVSGKTNVQIQKVKQISWFKTMEQKNAIRFEQHVQLPIIHGNKIMYSQNFKNIELQGNT